MKNQKPTDLKLITILYFIFLLFLSSFNSAINAQTGCINGTPDWCSGRNIKSNTARNGSGTLGNNINICRTGLNYVSSSVRLGQRFSPIGIPQPASFVIAGIPAGAVIEAAFVYAGTSGNGIAITANLTNPASILSSFPMSIIGSGGDKCWGFIGSFSYRADVTSSISGNGNYVISGLPVNASNDTDGATLIIIYSVPSDSFMGCISIDDGSIVNTIGGGTNNDAVTFTACGTNALPGARAFGIFADLQFNDNSLIFNGSPAPYSFNWWNFIEVSTTVTNSQTIANFSAQYPGDCVNWVAAGIYTRCEMVVTTPTLGQWGLIIFVILLLGTASAYSVQRQYALSGLSSTSNNFNFNIWEVYYTLKQSQSHFLKISSLIIMCLLLILFISIKFFSYELMFFDLIGIAISGFLIGLFMNYFQNARD